MGRRPRTFWAALWNGFLRVYGPVLGGLGILATVLVEPGNWQVPIRLAVVTSAVLVIVIATLVATTIDLFLSSASALPKVLWAKESDAGAAGRTVICLLEPSELFSHGTLSSFYYLDNSGFEVLLGIGAVLTIQEDGKVQVELTRPLQAHQDTIQRLARNEKTVLERIRVKPDVPQRYEAYIE